LRWRWRQRRVHLRHAERQFQQRFELQQFQQFQQFQQLQQLQWQFQLQQFR
jgi:hypothetical protein